jgi:hypothetical protein
MYVESLQSTISLPTSYLWREEMSFELKFIGEIWSSLTMLEQGIICLLTFFYGISKYLQKCSINS